MAKEAVREFQLPLTGSFSSLGPFTFGPWYYYILILSHFVIPSVWAPWIAVGLISISLIVIVIMYGIGKLLGNQWFGLILASLATFSPFQILSGAAMVQHSLVGPLTALALYLFLEIWLKKHSPLFGILKGIQYFKPNLSTQETIRKYADILKNSSDRRFSVYHCHNYDEALALTLYLDMQKIYDETGRKIGIESYYCPVIEEKRLTKKTIKKFPRAGLKMLDLEEATPGALLSAGWQLMSPKVVYNDVVRWWFNLQP